MYGTQCTYTLAFQRFFVHMKIISLIFICFSYVSLIRNSVTGPLTSPTVYHNRAFQLRKLRARANQTARAIISRLFYTHDYLDKTITHQAGHVKRFYTYVSMQILT
jgi:hypothetical protein